MFFLINNHGRWRTGEIYFWEGGGSDLHHWAIAFRIRCDLWSGNNYIDRDRACRVFIPLTIACTPSDYSIIVKFLPWLNLALKELSLGIRSKARLKNCNCRNNKEKEKTEAHWPILPLLLIRDGFLILLLLLFFNRFLNFIKFQFYISCITLSFDLFCNL